MELTMTNLVLAYLIGGLTLVPSTLLLVFVYSYFTLPLRLTAPHLDLTSEEIQAAEGEKSSSDFSDEEPSVAAGYFAVCREYVPGGVNGRPPSRTTPAGQTIAAESPRAYSSLYRSMFERKTAQPAAEGGKPVKKANNVFYVVLRHGHLMLFDQEDQLEVRHVISLTHYSVSIAGEGDHVPEGELYIKRNCIKLVSTLPGSSPFFLFCDNCSEKEDFHHALLRSQRALTHDNIRGIPEKQGFDPEDMIKLIRQLHVSEETAQTRWLNALAGRLFLAIYKTGFAEKLVAEKIKKKIGRVQKPAFLSSVTLQDVSLGDSSPVFLNPRLREMGVDGNLILEVDVKYSGHFKAVVAALARIDLGQRFKAREVELVLAGSLQRLEGHLLIMLKPPPSNRIWITFESMPKMDLHLEPIVSSRQITYGIILRAIESRIREVIGETLVSPNWDDLPFFSSEHEAYRGGIWKHTHVDSVGGDLVEAAQAGTNLKQEATSTFAGPALTPESDLELAESASSSLVDLELKGDHDSPSTPPSPMRSRSYTALAEPSPTVVTRVPVVSDLVQKRRSSRGHNAQRSLSSLSVKSPEGSPKHGVSASVDSLPDLKLGVASMTGEEAGDYMEPESFIASSEEADTLSPSSTITPHYKVREAGGSVEKDGTRNLDTPSVSSLKKSALNQSITSATAAAKRWSLSLGPFQRQNDTVTTPLSAKTMRAPMGRGSPLPPPGQPLPLPQSKTFPLNTASFTLARKPVSRSSTINKATPEPPAQKGETPAEQIASALLSRDETPSAEEGSQEGPSSGT